MHIAYMTANAAYGIFLDSRADGPLIDIDGKHFFESKKELREYLRPHRLGLKGRDIVPLEETEGDGRHG